MTAFFTLLVVEIGGPLLSAIASGVKKPTEEDSALRCEFGPITKTIGSLTWLVHSCSDGRTLMFTAGGSALDATPNVILSVSIGRTTVQRVNSDDFPSDEDISALEALTPVDVGNILDETRL